MPETNETKKINALLYEHNLEIALKNKTLSLLEKLYQKSILILSPADMAHAITDTIREDLNFEFTGIFIFEKKLDSLVPLAFSKSGRLFKTLDRLGFLFKDIKITDVKNRAFFKKAIYEKKESLTNNLAEVWGGFVNKKNLEEVKKESRVKTTLLYPMMTGQETLGALLFGLNRDYETVNTFEKESIKSFINVIALSLNKAYLYKDLQNANKSLKKFLKQRESLMHLINHRVKSSFTHSKYIFAEMLEGSFGAISPKLKEMAENGLESDNVGINTVDLVLNAANLQKGSIKYDMKKTDFKDLVLKVLSGKKIPAESKGLKIENKIKKDEYYILADAFWIKEAINNLIDNSIKYTLKGKITVGLKKRNGKILFSVKDTGMGIAEEDKKNLFTEGGRGKDSLKINVDSTGYGLYSVKLIVETHKGRAWAESEGADKGSTFFVELPLAQK